MLATRGGSQTPRLYHNSDRSEGSAEQRVLSGAPHRITTRVVATRGWHTNRVSWRAILVSHLAILCRDPKRLRAVFELRHEEGADHNRLTNLSARPSGGVIELRHEEGAGQNHNPVRGPRQGHRRFWSRTSTLTPGWIQPRDKPVSGFDRMDPCLTPG